MLLQFLLIIATIAMIACTGIIGVVATLIYYKIEKFSEIGRSILLVMGTNQDLLAQANVKLDLIDQKTTEEAAQIKAVVDDLNAKIDELSNQGVNTADLENLVARLDKTATNVENIYSADAGTVAGSEVPVPETGEGESGSATETTPTTEGTDNSTVDSSEGSETSPEDSGSPENGG